MKIPGAGVLNQAAKEQAGDPGPIIVVMKGISILFTFMLPVAVQAMSSVEPKSPIDGSVSSERAMQRLREGEILVDNARTDESGGSVRVQALMHSDLQVLWDFIPALLVGKE